MRERAIKKTTAVLHIDAIIAIALALLAVAKAFFANTGVLNVLLTAAPYLVLFAVVEALANSLKSEHKIAWAAAALYLPLHVVFASMVSQGGFIGFLGDFPYKSIAVSILMGYFLLSMVYGYIGLLSGQTLRVFFSKSGKIEKDTQR